MKRILFTMIIFTAYLGAMEPVNGEPKHYSLEDFPSEIKAALLTAPSFELAIAHIKTLRETSKSLKAFIDDDRMIEYLAQQYKKSPMIVAVSLGTPAAQNWFKKKNEDRKTQKTFQKNLKKLYILLIKQGMPGVNIPKALTWLENLFPFLYKIKEQYIQKAVHKRDIAMLANLLDKSYSKRTSYPELTELIHGIWNLVQEARHMRMERWDLDEKQMIKHTAQLQDRMQKAIDIMRLLIQHGAQLDESTKKLVTALINTKVLDKSDIQLLKSTQKVLQKKKK